MSDQYWAACQTFAGTEHKVRAEIEKMERGAFLPTYVRSYISAGKLSVGERPALPGYVFFRSTPDDWPLVQSIEGVVSVLLNDNRAMRVSPADMARMVLGHADGSRNQLEARPVTPSRERRKNSRKPRPGKRLRKGRTSVIPLA